MSYILAIFSAAFVPVHFFVPCEISSALTAISLLFFPVILILCFIGDRARSVDFYPATIGLFSMIFNLLCNH